MAGLNKLTTAILPLDSSPRLHRRVDVEDADDLLEWEQKRAGVVLDTMRERGFELSLGGGRHSIRAEGSMYLYSPTTTRLFPVLWTTENLLGNRLAMSFGYRRVYRMGHSAWASVANSRSRGRERS